MATPLPPFRSLDGSGNNLRHPRWGASGSRLVRRATVAYEDGAGAPAGAARPSARLVSNRVCKQERDRLNALRLTDLVWLWGQFLNHTLNQFPSAQPLDPFPIEVPADDPEFSPGSHLPVARSAFDLSTGTDPGNPRQQVNRLTSYIDASTVYGADEGRAAAVRTVQRVGPVAVLGAILRTSEGPDGPLLPLNAAGLQNDLVGPSPDYFLAGDDRANTGFGLMAIHTLFVREHNRIVAEVLARTPRADTEGVYQTARKWVGAHIQAVTFEEFLPAVLGPGAVGPYRGYDPDVDATMGNEFATFGFRFGHSMLSPFLQAVADDGTVLERVRHRDALLNIGMVRRHGVGPVIKGFAAQVMQETDVSVIEDMRSIRFPGAPPLDLIALDLQRARDHGVPDYNQCRRCFGLPPARTVADITPDAEVQCRLAGVYGGVDAIDPLIGGLAEPHAPDSTFGVLLRAVIAEQLSRTRAGDRYWYECDPFFRPEDVAAIRRTRLADIIRRNTAITNIQDNVFVLPCP